MSARGDVEWCRWGDGDALVIEGGSGRTRVGSLANGWENQFCISHLHYKVAVFGDPTKWNGSTEPLAAFARFRRNTVFHFLVVLGILRNPFAKIWSERFPVSEVNVKRLVV